jgi:hypothetical protein
MTQLSYDNTFEGLQFSKFMNTNIRTKSVKDDLQQNLFCEKIEITTDVSKSDRVIKNSMHKLEMVFGCIIWAFLSEKPAVEDDFRCNELRVQNPINIMKDFRMRSVLQNFSTY